MKHSNAACLTQAPFPHCHHGMRQHASTRPSMHMCTPHKASTPAVASTHHPCSQCWSKPSVASHQTLNHHEPKPWQPLLLLLPIDYTRLPVGCTRLTTSAENRQEQQQASATLPDRNHHISAHTSSPPSTNLQEQHHDSCCMSNHALVMVTETPTPS